MKIVAAKERGYASKAEIVSALERLSEKELAGLQRFAKLRSVGLPDVGWEDLLQEAVERALAGRRKWPREITFFAFLCGTMRSLASGYWKSLKSRPGALEQLEDLPSAEDKFTVSPEAEALSRSAIRQLEQLFLKDAAALAVLRGMAEGLSPEEIQAEAGLDGRQYASTQRRIRRTVDRALESGML